MSPYMHKLRLIPPCTGHIQVAVPVDVAQSGAQMHFFPVVNNELLKMSESIIIENEGGMFLTFVLIRREVDIAVVVDVAGVQVV